MLKRVVTAAVTGLAGFCLAASAHAAVVDFEDLVIPAPYDHVANNLITGGLHFMDQDFTLVPAGAGFLPNNSGTQYIELGSGNDAPDPNLVFSLNAGGAFNLESLKLGLGDWNDQATDGYDAVTIVGVKAANCQFDCGQVSQTLHVTYDWTQFDLTGFTGLASVTVMQQIYIVNGHAAFTPTSLALHDAFGDQFMPTTVDGGWLAFDDITYSVDPTGGVGIPGGPVPEPAAWALMIAGFGLTGAAMRRRRADLLAH